MARLLRPPHALLSAARAHFALTQPELARYLGLTAAHLADAEAGRRRLGPAAERRLAPLLDHLPPPLSSGRPLPALPPLPPLPLPPAEAARLRARLRRCRHVAQELADELSQAARAAAAHQRRRQGLAALRTALLPTAADIPNPIPPSPFADATHDAAWLARLEEGTAAARRPPPRPRRAGPPGPAPAPAAGRSRGAGRPAGRVGCGAGRTGKGGNSRTYAVDQSF